MNPFRRYRHDRRAVGGWFAELLTESQFQILLTLVIVAVGLNVVARSIGGGGMGAVDGGWYSGGGGYSYNSEHVAVSFLTAPVTAACLLFLIYLYFEADIRGHSMLNNWNRRYSFQPACILYGREYHRLLTGQLIHGNKFHLYMNVSSLAMLGREEYILRNYHGVPIPGFAIYLFALTITTGIAHVYLVKWFKHAEDMRTYSVGFSGVLFALKVLGNYNRFGMSTIGIPVLADAIAFHIPIQVPIFLQHFFELFIISMVFPQASFWGHLAGIVAGYIFAFLGNVKRIATWIWTGTFPPPAVIPEKPPSKNRPGRPENPIKPAKPTKRDMFQQYLNSCFSDFETEHGDTSRSAKALCRKNAKVLVDPYPTPASAFSNCIQGLWTHSTRRDTYLDEYYEYRDYDEYSGYNGCNQRSPNSGYMHTDDFGALFLDDNDPLVMAKAKAALTKKADSCSRQAIQDQCEAREIHYLELFRGEYSLTDRLEMLVNLESNCETQAETQKNATYVDVGEMALNTSYAGDGSRSSANRKRRDTAEVKPLKEIMEMTKACTKRLQSLTKEDLEERFPQATSATTKAYCAKQTEFSDCLGLPKKESVYDALSSMEYQTKVARCFVKVKGGKGIAIPLEQASVGSKAALKKDSVNGYVSADNAFVFIATAVVIFVAQRIFARNGADMDHRQEEITPRPPVDGSEGEGEEVVAIILELKKEGNSKSFKKSDTGDTEDSPDSKDVVAEEEHTVSAGSSCISTESDSGDTEDSADSKFVEEEEEHRVSEAFNEALHDLCTKNEKSSENISKALKVLETMIVNATTKGQADEADPEAKKFRRIKPSNRVLLKYQDLQGVMELAFSVGFTLSTDEDDGGTYLTYPFDPEGIPKWLDRGLDQMRQMHTGTSPSKPEGSPKKEPVSDGEGTTEDVKRRAANAAIKRLAVAQQKSAESRVRSKSKKFTLGMGGGEASSTFYPGST